MSDDPRPLRDRLGEAIRIARHGTLRPVWADLDDYFRDMYRREADGLVIAARNRGIAIADIVTAGQQTGGTVDG